MVRIISGGGSYALYNGTKLLAQSFRKTEIMRAKKDYKNKPWSKRKRWYSQDGKIEVYDKKKEDFVPLNKKPKRRVVSHKPRVQSYASFNPIENYMKNMMR